MMGSKLRAKILLLGDGAVGKTAFRKTWLEGAFKAQYLMTLGADYASKEISFYHSPTKLQYLIKFLIWDLAGQPTFKVVRNLYYRGAIGALCFFDVTNRDSLINLGEWIRSYWSLNGSGKRPLLIVGTKCDLRNDPNYPVQVSPAKAIEFAMEITDMVEKDGGFTVHYIETSAKENINVEEAFRLLAQEIIKYVNYIEKDVKIQPPSSLIA